VYLLGISDVSNTNWKKLLGSLLAHSFNGFCSFWFVCVRQCPRNLLALQTIVNFWFFIFADLFLSQFLMVLISIFVLLFWSSLDYQLVYKPFFCIWFYFFLWNLCDLISFVTQVRILIELLDVICFCSCSLCCMKVAGGVT